MHSDAQPTSKTFNRAALLSVLFRETDRIQRSGDFLSLVLFELDNFDPNLPRRLSELALHTLIERIRRLLRSFDTLGRTGEREFLLILPGCSVLNASLLAERLRAEVFAEPALTEADGPRLTASIGISSSEGRSPIVVLREAETALRQAQEAGGDSIHTFVRRPDFEIEPIEFLS